MLKLFVKPTVFLACLIPLASALLALLGNRLGANPVEALLQSSGEWALRLLMLTLMVTPLQLLLKWGWVAKLRRMLGLFAFFYGCLHLAIWLALDQALDWSLAMSEILDKPFITLGLLTLTAMVPLAVTSNRFSVRKLGIGWKRLHRIIYPLTVLAIVHLVWQVKGSELIEPLVYLSVLVVLLGWRFSRLLKSAG